MTTVAESQTHAPTLVAIAIAARRAGDRDLERYARERLRAGHGVRLSFTTQKPQKREAQTR